MFLGPITAIRKQKMRESIKYEKNIQRLKTLYSSTLEPVTIPSRLRVTLSLLRREILIYFVEEASKK